MSVLYDGAGTYTGNCKVLHKNGSRGRGVQSWYVARHLASLSPEQPSMIRSMCIPHIGMKRKPSTKAGSPNIPVHMVATYDALQAVLSLLSHYVLQRLPDVHTCVDTFAVYKRNNTRIFREPSFEAYPCY